MEEVRQATDDFDRQQVYDDCLHELMGYTGMCFVDIWNKASKKAHGEYALDRTETPRKGVGRASEAVNLYQINKRPLQGEFRGIMT